MPTQQANYTEQINDVSGGWIPTSVPIIFVSTDNPSYLVSVNYNVTGTFGVGMKMQLTHQASVKNFIITQVTFTGTSTQINLYGGTDFTLNVTGAITNPQYSMEKSPFGFNIDPDKWTVSLYDTTNAIKNSPVANTVYNMGVDGGTSAMSVSMPIGKWWTSLQCTGEVITTLVAVATTGINIALSTANNSVSDNRLKGHGTATLPVGADTYRVPINIRRLVSAISKTIYYLVMFTGASSTTSIAIRGDVTTTQIDLVCAYL